MHERLRLYDIFRVVSLQSCQHEYIRVRDRGSIRSVRNIHNGNVGGSDHNIHNGNVLRSVRVRLRLLMPGALKLQDLKQKVTLMLQLLQHSDLELRLGSLLCNMKSQIKVLQTN